MTLEQPGTTPDVELIAASLRADLSDLDVFFEVLAGKLSAALRGLVQVQRGGGLFGRGKRVRQVEVSLGDHRFVLEHQEGAVRAEVVHQVRGVRLSGEQVGVDDWFARLATELAHFAAASGQARAALQRLLG